LVRVFNVVQLHDSAITPTTDFGMTKHPGGRQDAAREPRAATRLQTNTNRATSLARVTSS
jgi:hypothetical protein